MATLTKSTPKLRFKDGNGYPGWSSFRLGEIFNINAGGDIERSRVKKTKDDHYKYPVYSNGMGSEGLCGYTDTFKQKGGCITVTGRGTLGVAVARHEPFYPIVRILVLCPKKEIDINFSEYLINNMNFFIESTGVPQLTGPQISTYRAFLPSIQEQKKIADFLTTVDNKISLLEKKTDLLERYKGGGDATDV